MKYTPEIFMIYENVTELIGKTPLMRLHSIEKAYGLKAKLYAKLEESGYACCLVEGNDEIKTFG